jgi:hypothetical protein
VDKESKKDMENAEDVFKNKWDELKRWGIQPPKDAEENAKRLREAHGY